MSITKKMLFFVSMLVILPMMALLLISSLVLDSQLEKSALSYLNVATKIFQNSFNSRQQEMENTSEMMVKELQIKNAMEMIDIEILSKKALEFKEVYNYLDFVYFLDQKQKLILSTVPLKNLKTPSINNMLEISLKNNRAVSSLQVLELEDLFFPNSSEYNRYKIDVFQGDNGAKTYLTKCLASLTVTPIYKEDNLLGYFIIGDILNNDNYFPQVYTESIKDSYLAISIDGIRITSNIRSPIKADFIGSSIPTPLDLESPMDFHYGRVNIDDEIHLYLDIPLLDYQENIIAILGVGIPEHRFYNLMNTNQHIISIVAAICLVVTLIIGRKTGEKLTRPIVEATKLAEQISAGKKDIVLEESFLLGGNDETTILLQTFKKMADDLNKSEQKINSYLEELHQINQEQEVLTEQLQLLNNELEEKVVARTQDLREAITALKKADQVKSLFMANMSHELRTPLNAIICSSEALRDGLFGSLNEKQKKYIDNIFNSSTHLLQLINDILDISKIEAGKMTLSLGIYPISEIVHNSFDIVKSLAYRKNIEVSFDLNPPDFKIKVDAKKLKQILYNLLSNAVKFTPENGKVEVKITKFENVIKILVKDNGIGIKDEDQEKVFVEFEQVDSSYEKEYEGTGLGLPLTKKLVEMHGGEIHLHSKPNEGTEVLITLPIDID